MPQNPIAIVTGSSRGIGAATARRLAQSGYDLCINYISNKSAADHIVASLVADGTRAIAVQADVSKEPQVVELFTTVDQELGPVTALVNNAAILRPQSRVEDMTADRINAVLTTNVTSVLLCCKHAIKRMSHRHGGNGGAIVNVSSAAARIGAGGEYVDYAASKGAIDALTKGLAIEVAGEGIRVNGVRPGYIYTDMHADGGEPQRVDRLASAIPPTIPMQRGGQPEEIAHTITWLLSNEASYITGTLVDAAGGR